MPGAGADSDPGRSRRAVRRGLAVMTALLVLLLGAHGVQNALVYRDIDAIASAGGIVDSYSPGPLGSYWLPQLLGDSYVLRDDYSVFFGDRSHFHHTCGSGRTLFFGDRPARDNGNAAAAAAGQLAGVRELNFVGISLDDRGLGHLAGMHALTDLGLYGSRVTGAGLSHLRRLKRLDSLALTKTTLHDEAFDHLIELRQLQHLDLSGSCFDGDQLARLAEHPKLQSLTLDRACVQPQHLRHLIDSRINHLSLYGVAIDDSAIPHLEALADVDLVYLHQTKISDKAAAASSHPAVRKIPEDRRLESLFKSP